VQRLIWTVKLAVLRRFFTLPNGCRQPEERSSPALGTGSLPGDAADAESSPLRREYHAPGLRALQAGAGSPKALQAGARNPSSGEDVSLGIFPSQEQACSRAAPSPLHPAGTQHSGPHPGKHLRASLSLNTGNSLKTLKVCGFTDLKTRSSHEVGVPEPGWWVSCRPHAPQCPGMERGPFPFLPPLIILALRSMRWSPGRPGVLQALAEHLRRGLIEELSSAWHFLPVMVLSHRNQAGTSSAFD